MLLFRDINVEARWRRNEDTATTFGSMMRRAGRHDEVINICNRSRNIQERTVTILSRLHFLAYEIYINTDIAIRYRSS